MKKIVFIFLFLISFQAFSMNLSPIIGGQQNSPSNDKMNYQGSSGQGMRLGALSHIELAPSLSLRTGFIWNQRNFSGSVDTGFNIRLEYAQKVTYLDIPLNVEYKIPSIDLYVFGGLLYAAKLSDSYEYSPSLASIGLAETNPHQLSKSDMLINLGLGYMLWNFESFKVSGEIEYHHGLTNINATSGATGTVNQRTTIISILGTFLF